MNLTYLLNSEGINIEQLQKGLKHIGLNISKFDSAQEDQIPGLIELFKIAVDIDPRTTTKFNKMDLRSKLEKVLKGQPVTIHNNSVAITETSEKNVVSSEQFKTVYPNSKPQRQAPIAPSHKKLGKIKFFDSTKGFGYVHSYDDKKDCFIHVSKLITTGIDEDDIVMFETVDSRKKPGELDAIKVSNKIPVFIFNKESASKSITDNFFTFQMCNNCNLSKFAITFMWIVL